MRDLESVKAEVLELAKTRVLTGVHGPLPKGTVPVRELNTREECPPSWTRAFKKYGAMGKHAFWHGIEEECTGGPFNLLIRRLPDRRIVVPDIPARRAGIM
jgi:hypothetical protein